MEVRRRKHKAVKLVFNRSVKSEDSELIQKSPRCEQKFSNLDRSKSTTMHTTDLQPTPEAKHRQDDSPQLKQGWLTRQLSRTARDENHDAD